MKKQNISERLCQVQVVEGLTPYEEGLDLQEQATKRLIETGVETLLLLQHEPVITHGRRSNEDNVLLPKAALQKRGVALFETNRGGDVTYHGPGQLVGYPIIDLNPDRRDIHRYMRDLEETLILTCADFGVVVKRQPGLTGVWTESEPSAKVAAMGVHVSRWRTSHGFALNVNTDLSAFSLIVPCGLTKPVTSLEKESGKKLTLDQVAQVYVKYFKKIFNRSGFGE